MPGDSYSAKQLIDIQDKINSSTEEQAAFVKNPKAYLKRSGITLPKEFQKELDQNISELSKGPRSFTELAAMNNRSLGIMISIRIPF
jgi:Zn-dependent oligopeptidase